jgi:NTE family protein
MPVTPAGPGTVAGLAISFLLSAGPVADVSAQSSAPPSAPAVAATLASNSVQARPRVGLALGGGAARGIAHIGLLRWFEEHRIPIDYLAGTSMGGLVGGAYASGLSPDEIEAMMKQADWNLMFLGDSPYRYKTFRRKEDARAFPGMLDFGLKGGFKLPSGLNAGQQVELMLDAIALPYFAVKNFDELPTPFRCVATDIRAGEPLVMGDGSFARALRATMSIPAVFTPVALDERLLVDGGALNNVPADVVKKMGADVAIAVNVSSSTDPPSPPTTIFAVLGQTLDSLMTVGTREALKSADLIIVPDLKGLTGGDWRRADDLIAKGYEAAAASSAALLRYQVDEATYAEWSRARQGRRRTATPMVDRVVVEGLPPVETERLTASLQARHGGRPLDRDSVEDSVLRIGGTDRYELITQALRATPAGTELVIHATPKSYGPPFLLPAIDLHNIDSNAFSLNLRMRVAVYDTPLPNSEVRLDAGIGTDQLAAIELYKLVGRRGLFVAPRAYFNRYGVNGYQDGEFVAEYRLKRTGAGIDVGYTTGLRSEVRLGYDASDVRLRLRVGPPTLPEASGSDSAASLRWVFDGQNSPMVPSRGLRVRTAMRYFLDTPDIVDSEGAVVRTADDVPQGEVVSSWFTRIRTRQRVFVAGGAGTSFGEDPGINQFRLGGALRLGALNTDEIRGDNYVLGLVGLLHEWFRLPDVLGGNVYLGGWLEQGSAYNRWADAEYQSSLTAGILVETLFGPTFLGYSQSLNQSSGRFYISLGPFLR